nr:hybrid signal transduction histidine kinase M [Tanacetum cinerariifolium]
MTGPQVTTTTLLSDKLALVTHHHLLTRVPVKLDFENWNYGSWEYFFDQLFSSYEVSKYIHGSTVKSPPLTPEELKVDKIVLSWIFTTLSDPLQARLVVERPKYDKEAWDLISDIVKDNKRSRTNALKAELRSIKLGDQSMKSYFRKIESIVTILTSLDSYINDEDVVHYALQGLPDKYDQVCGFMHFKDTFLDFKMARSMLIAKEMRLLSKSLALPVDSSFASPMVLMAEQTLDTLLLHKSSHGDLVLVLLRARVGDMSKGSSNNDTTNDLLLKLIGELGSLGVTVSQNMVPNGNSSLTVSHPIAYKASPSPFSYTDPPQPTMQTGLGVSPLGLLPQAAHHYYQVSSPHGFSMPPA